MNRRPVSPAPGHPAQALLPAELLGRARATLIRERMEFRAKELDQLPRETARTAKVKVERLALDLVE